MKQETGDGLTTFSWGYHGWGNHTPELVKAVDAVEASRGWGAPIFVDVRASRRVRAPGFRERAFEKTLGPARYVWMRELGNRGVLERDHAKFELIDPTVAADLMTVVVTSGAEKKRVIFFCSCDGPTAECHRTLVRDALLVEARKRAIKLTVVEWPGYESDPVEVPTVKVDAAMFRKLDQGLGGIRLDGEAPPVWAAALPWYSLVRVQGPNEARTFLGGPARCTTRGWVIPVMGWPDAESLLADRQEAREMYAALPFNA